MLTKIKNNLIKMRSERPLVLNVTNYVTMDFVANGLLSLGASPIMTHAKQELADLMKLANSVVINLGTLDDNFIGLCQQTCELASQFNKPIILDPVGAGASQYRTKTALQLIQDHPIAVVRGNASEIMALANSASATKGVDSVAQSSQAIESAQQLSAKINAAIVVSGKTDIIIDAEQIHSFERGSSLMPLITGSGCLLSAVVGAFHAILPDRFAAANQATYFYALCGEIAAEKSERPGFFKPQFLDALNSLPNETSQP